MKKEQAFSGLEAAIVLIAFVVVAAVFSYVMLGAGFFATQKAQEVTYSGIQQSTSNMVIDGNIYGTLESGKLAQVTFDVNVPIGGQAQDMKKVTFAWSTEVSKGPVNIVYGTVAKTEKTFTAKTTDLQPGEKTKVVITAPIDDRIAAGQWFTMEMKPKIGAATLTKKTLTTGYKGGVIT